MKKIFTEKEILEALERQAFLIDQKLNQQNLNIKEANTLVHDCAINLNNNKDFTLKHLGVNFEKVLNISTQNLLENPFYFVKNLVYPGDFEKGVNLTKNFILNNKKPTAVGYIQRIKPMGSNTFLPLYTVTKHSSQSDDLISIVVPVNKLTTVSNKMVRALEETLYTRHNYHKFAALTNREQEIITLLALGYQNNEIGEQLFISKATVEQHRKNLKRKLEIKRFVDLIRFAQAFDLI